jgi:hypothetical protein
VVQHAILSHGILPQTMETDSANPSRGIIAGSGTKVDEADAYVVLISSYRYGQHFPLFWGKMRRSMLQIAQETCHGRSTRHL